MSDLGVHESSRHWRLTRAAATSAFTKAGTGDPPLQTLQKTASRSIPTLRRTNYFLIWGQKCPFMGNRLGPGYAPHMKATLLSFVAS